MRKAEGGRWPHRFPPARGVADAVVGLVVILTLGACGGGGLKYTVDDATLERVPPGERQGVLEARKEAEVAEDEMRTVDSHLEVLDRDAYVAQKEKEGARWEVEKTLSEQEGARASRDENQANTAAHNKEVADLGLKVAEAKIEWLKQKKDWLKQSRTAAEAHVEAAKARIELEKARVAEQRGIKPGDGFQPSNYQSQWQDRTLEWESKKKNAESEANETKQKEQRWKDLATHHQKLRGN